MTARGALRDMRERLDDTAGWLEWISPRATTEIAVVYADGDVYLPTGGTAEEFAFANARGNVHPLMRKDGAAALVGALEAVLTHLDVAEGATESEHLARLIQRFREVIETALEAP